MPEDDQMANVRFGIEKKFGPWVIKAKLDEGGFGQVYRVENFKGEVGALKAESNDVEGGSAIKLETMILKQLNKNGPQPHIPVVYHAAKRNKFCYMVMTLLGKNLKKLKNECDEGRFTRGTWSRIGIQCLYGLKYIHDCGFIHRDIKPQNFVLGNPTDTERCRMVHVLDFGLARPFATYSEKKKEWVVRKARATAQFRGTLRYTSPNVHNKKEQARLDDIWSLIFVLVELNGGLPWQTERDREVVVAMKMQMDAKTVMMNMPICMGGVIPHLEKLNYYQRPDYFSVFKALWQVMTDEKVQTWSRYDFEGSHGLIPWISSPFDEEKAKKAKPMDWENPDGAFFKLETIGSTIPTNNKDDGGKSEADALKSVGK